MSTRHAVLSAVVAAVFASSAHAVVYVNQNFDAAADGSFPFGPGAGTGGHIDRYEGGGPISVTSAVYQGASGKSVAIVDSSTTTSVTSVLFGRLPTINSGQIEFSFDFNQTHRNSISFFGFGGNRGFGTSAAQLAVDNGGLRLFHGNGSGTLQLPVVGAFEAGVWNNVRFVFDVDAKKFDFFFNNTLLADDFGFQDGYPANFSTAGVTAFELGSDSSTRVNDTTPVLYLDNMLVQSVPEPTALASASLAAVSLLSRRRR